MRRIFFDIDTQIDFCTTYGNLSVTSTDDIAITRCKRLVAHACEEHNLIIGSVDTHHYDSWEFYTNPNLGPKGEKPNFKPHCVKGTTGWNKLQGTLVERYRYIPDYLISDPNWAQIIPPDIQAIYLEKNEYSLFTNPNTLSILAHYILKPVRSLDSKEQIEFVVFGVATEYCVKAAAIGLHNWIKGVGLEEQAKVILVKNAIAGVKLEDAEKAITEMEEAGIKMVEAKEYIGEDIKPMTKHKK